MTTATATTVSSASILLAPQVICHDVFVEKYAKANEVTHHDVYARVAKGLAVVEAPELRAKYEKLFFDNMVDGALGAGRIMSAAGTGIKATLANCFVQAVGDCIQGMDSEGFPGIYEALRMAAETMRRGGGVGYNFSRIRPKNAKVKGTQSEASGPCSYMDVFDASCRTVESAGSRRGAQMGVLRIDHPDVFEFITAKRTQGRWNNFNVSVGVVAGFMQALDSKSTWELVHRAEPSDALIAAGSYKREDGMWVYQTVNAADIWDTIMRSTYDFAEPGVVFLDNMNTDNNLRYCELIEATNPCGEQPLPSYGCCDLGPINLTRFVINQFGFNNTTPMFDFDRFAVAVSVQVRMLDNVLDATMWPLPEQELESKNKRRVGVGFTGLGDALVMMNLRYDAQEGRDCAERISRCLRDSAYMASVELAKERGAFPLFDADKYLEKGTFASRLPAEIQKTIRKFGIRNSHLVSIAPVGTISLAFCDNASNGIEPAFSWSYNRKKRMADGSSMMYSVEDHAFRVYLQLAEKNNSAFPEKQIRDALTTGSSLVKVDESFTAPLSQFLPASFVTALDMSATDHLKMMETVQPFIDSAISKTVNVPADYSFDDFKSLYSQAYHAKLKGLATYRPNATLGSVLSVPVAAPVVEVAPEPVVIPVSVVAPIVVLADSDPLKLVIEHRPEGELQAISEKITYFTQDGKKSLYVIMSFMPVKGVIDGKEVSVNRPIEVFIPAGQECEAQQWINMAMRSLSLNARSGFMAKALKDMRKVSWDRGPVRCGIRTKYDGQVIPMTHDSEVAAIGFALQQILVRKGFLDSDGNQIPARILVANQAPVAPVLLEEELTSANGESSSVAAQIAAVAYAEVIKPLMMQHGKKCAECGANAVVPRDGCGVCTACNSVGSCG
jgi:ribonucleoside-diphosphate reductase alpha chain